MRDMNSSEPFFFVDSPLKLTKRWRKNHEEEQMRNQTISSALFSDTNRKSTALDLSFSPTRSSNTSIVNWLNQTTSSIVAQTSMPSVSSTLSSNEASPSSPSSSEEPFSCLYLLASAAVGELERQRLKSSSVQNIALAVNS